MSKCFECGLYTKSKNGYCAKCNKIKKELHIKALKIYGKKSLNWSLRGLIQNLDHKSNWVKFMKFRNGWNKA